MANLSLPTSILDSRVVLKFIDNGDGTWSPQVSTGSGAAGAAVPAGVPSGATGPFTFGLSYSGVQTNTKLITVGAGTFIYLVRAGVRISKAVTSASSAARFGFHASTTPAVANCVDGHPGIDPGGGFNAGTGGAVIGKGGDGEDLMFDATALVGGTGEVYGTFYLAGS